MLGELASIRNSTEPQLTLVDIEVARCVLVQVDTERYSDMLEVEHTFDHCLVVDTQADLDTVRMEVDKPLLTPSLIIKSKYAGN